MDDVREMVMVIGSHHGMQHNDVVQEEVAEGYTTKVCARELEYICSRHWNIVVANALEYIV